MENDVVRVAIDGLTYGGSFIGRITNGPLAGKKAFVRGAAPNEVISACITADKKSYVKAELTQIEQRHEQRVVPPCPYFGNCGGCDLQYLGINAQREAKRNMVEDTLKFQGKIAALQGVTLLGEGLPAYEYRRRITLHVDESGASGFYRPNSGDVVDISRCLISHVRINEALLQYRSDISKFANVIGSVVLEEYQDQVFAVLRLRDESDPKVITESLSSNSAFAGIPVRIEQRGQLLFSNSSHEISLGHFSQINDEGNMLLVQTVLSLVTSRRVTELYAGSGNFSIPLAQSGKNVTAVELDPVLTSLGEKAVDSLSIASQLRFITQSAEQFVIKNKMEETVLLDPPRAGAKAVVQKISPKQTANVVYVSCNLPSFCRDLQILMPRYELEKVFVIDMFAQTHHVETIGVLRAR